MVINYSCAGRDKMYSIISILTIALVILCSFRSSAQGKIYGKVVDETGKPIPSANALLLNAKDSSLVKGIIVSGTGTFNFVHSSGSNLMITITHTGYTQYYTAPITGDGVKDIDLGTITLKQQDKQLSAVTIVTKKPFIEQKIDRMVINVKNSITSTGSTALEVLERSPGVFVDRQNNTLSLSGKNGVVVMINGKINHMPMDALVQMLAGMNASNIEKIELITTPPANFDAEGNAGFINIVLVSNPSYGTNGSYALTASYGEGEGTLASVNFNHRNKKINISGDLSFSRIHMPQLFEFYRLVRNVNKTVESYSSNDRNTLQRNYNVRLGLDYQLSKKTLVGAELTGYDNRWSMDAKNDNFLYVNNRPDTSIHIFDVEVNRWFKYGGSFNIQHIIKDNETLNIEYDIDHYTDNNPNDYSNAYYDSSGRYLFDKKISSGKKTPININVASIDYAKKINKSIDLNTGVKYSSYRFTNDVIVNRFSQNQWTTDKDFTAIYFLKEDVAAAFASVSIAINEKDNIKAGLRYEYTLSNLGTSDTKDIVDRKYGKLFPSLFISHKINDNNAINFSYSKRISRPTFRDLAPFVYFLDPNTYISGNAALQPSISNAASISYTLKKFLCSVSYSEEKDFIASFQSKVDTVSNKQYLIAQNYPLLKTASLTLSLPFSITSWWSMQNNIIGQWQRVDAIINNQPLQLDQANYNIVTTQTFQFPHNYSGELQAFYSSPQLSGTYLFKSIGALNLGIQKKLNGQQGKLSFNVRDILNSLVGKVYVNLPAQNMVTTGLFKFSTRTYSLTYSKNFGSNQIKTSRKQSTAAEEERKRVE